MAISWRTTPRRTRSSSPAATSQDRKDLYDLEAHKAPHHHEEISIPRSQIVKMESYGPWHNTYLAIYFTLTGLHALHVIGGAIVIGFLWGPGSKLWETDPRALHQPHRDLRPVLALRGPGLDFPLPCLILDISSYDCPGTRKHFSAARPPLPLCLLRAALRHADHGGGLLHSLWQPRHQHRRGAADRLRQGLPGGRLSSCT